MMSSPPTIITIRNLDFQFGSFKALDNISLNVPTGSIYGFLGPNGAGKTTTIRILLDLFHSQAGQVEIFGQSILQDREAILGRVGALIETPSIYKHLSGRQNLEVLRRMLGLPEKRVDEVLEIVRLRANADKKAKEYSLGMCQRLGLAAALLNDPELLILDEPTNGLDPSGIIEMRELILELNKEHGKTIFLSSHILPEIEKLVTHLAIIDRGSIRYEGTLADLQQQQTGHRLHIAVSDAKRAAELAAENDVQLLEQTVRGIVVQVNDEQAIAQLNRLLVLNDLDVYQLSATDQGLEAIFLNVTQKLDA